MKAIVQDTYGSADVLELRDIDRPELGRRRRAVRVRAAGVDRGAWHLMTGQPYLMRLAGFGLRAPKDPRPGHGRRRAWSRRSAGTSPASSRATRCSASARARSPSTPRAREDKLAPKPANLTFEQAAAVPVSGLTALQALRDHGKVQPGQKVLVIGASGGVGTFAVQIAKAFGAEVTGVCSTAKVDLVRSLGADHVIDYTREDFASSGQRYDLILDIGGNRRCRACGAPSPRRGRSSSSAARPAAGGSAASTASSGRSCCRRSCARSWARSSSRRTREDLSSCKELIEAGKVTPVIDRTYPLSEVPDAIRYLEQGHARGKVVITV